MTHDTDTDTLNTDTAKGTLTATALCAACHSVPAATWARRHPLSGPMHHGPQHTGDCRTARGRLLARVCRDCGQRFPFPKRTAGRFVRCRDCRDRAAVKRAARRTAAFDRKHRSGRSGGTTPYAEHRAACEREALGEQRADLQRAADWAALVYAVERMICCPESDCGRILDADRAVLISIGTRQGICCADCFDTLHAARVSDCSAATVADGRALGDARTKGSTR